MVGRYPRLDWHELFAGDAPDADWLVEPILERGKLVSLYHDRAATKAKAGKSLLALEIAAALAAGRPVFGNPERSARVLYVDLENDPHTDILERLTAFGYAAGDLDRLAYLSFPNLPPLDTRPGGQELHALALAYKAELVIIDTVSRVVAGKENDSDTIRALYRFALVPLKRDRITVLRIDHPGKDSARGQRGTSAKDDDVDAVWQLATRGTRLTLTRTLSRGTHGADTLHLVRRFEPLRHEPAAPAEQLTDAGRRALEILDNRGAPADLGRDRARSELLNADVKISNDDLATVIRVRKDQARLSAGDMTQLALGEPAPDSEEDT